MRLVVWVAPETRKAVGVWRRPHTLTTRLNNITTDALISVPDGSAGWSKEAGKNYVLCFRQSCAPALWGPVNADDVQWLGGYQDLRSEEHASELQSRENLVCRLLLEKKKKNTSKTQ